MVDTLLPEDGRIHGVESAVAAAQGRVRSRRYDNPPLCGQHPGQRLSRKQRLPANRRYIAKVAASCRRQLEAELVERRGGEDRLTSLDYEALDLAYWADVGTLRAAVWLERNDWVNEKTKDFHPLINSVARLKSMKMQAMRMVGLDRAPEPLSAWSKVWGPDGSGDTAGEGDPSPSELGKPEPELGTEAAGGVEGQGVASNAGQADSEKGQPLQDGHGAAPACDAQPQTPAGDPQGRAERFEAILGVQRAS